jgi:hypothetical protein
MILPDCEKAGSQENGFYDAAGAFFLWKVIPGGS